MSQPYIALPDVYRFRMQKFAVADPTDVWYNEWDVRYDPSVLPTPSDPWVTAIIGFETAIHYPTVKLNVLEVYAYHVGVPPGGPGSSFAAAFDVNVTGTKGIGGWHGLGDKDIGGEVCVMVQKFIQFSRRISHNFYRGCLQQNDVAAEAGAEWRYGAGSPDFASFNTIVAGTIGQYTDAIVPVPSPILVRVHATKDPTTKLITALHDTTINRIALSPNIATNKISRKSSR